MRWTGRRYRTAIENLLSICKGLDKRVLFFMLYVILFFKSGENAKRKQTSKKCMEINPFSFYLSVSNIFLRMGTVWIFELVILPLRSYWSNRRDHCFYLSLIQIRNKRFTSRDKRKICAIKKTRIIRKINWSMTYPSLVLSNVIHNDSNRIMQ